MRKKDKDLDILMGKVLLGYKQFHLNKILHEKVKTRYYHKFEEVWNRILVSLEIGFWSELTKIFEKPSKNFDRTLSIYDLPNISFKGYKRKIEKIRKLRNKIISHNDLKTLRNLQRFLAKLGLKRDDAEQLFEKTIEVLDVFHSVYIKPGESLRSVFDEAKLDIQNKAKRFVKYSDRDASVKKSKNPRNSS